MFELTGYEVTKAMVWKHFKRDILISLVVFLELYFNQGCVRVILTIFTTHRSQYCDYIIVKPYMFDVSW